MGRVARGAPKPRTELLTRLFDAANAGDIDAVAAHYHPDAELRLSETYTAPGTAYHGREGLRTLLQEVFPSIGLTRLVPRRLTEFEDSVLVKILVEIDGRARVALVLYTFVDDLIARVEEFRTEADAIAAATTRHVLTPREREVFALLAKGRKGPQIASELFLSPETVRTHVQNGVERLGARTRVQAVAIALARGEIAV